MPASRLVNSAKPHSSQPKGFTHRGILARSRKSHPLTISRRGHQGGLPGLNPLHRPQINQDINQRIVVGNRTLITKLGSLNAQGHRLTIDPLIRRALPVHLSISRTFPVQLMAQPCPYAGSYGRSTSPGLPFFMGYRAACPGRFRIEPGANIAAALMGDEQTGAVLIGELEGNGKRNLSCLIRWKQG